MAFPPIDPPPRVLMGPGPSDVAPSVLRAMSAPTLGHMDPAFLAIMDEVRSMLRSTFGTENEWTLPMSGTGSAGMETVMVNLLEPGDAVLVGVNGVFGGRMAEVATRCGAEVVRVEAPWGRPIDPDDIRRAGAGRPFRLIALVHAETSTGVLQDLAPMRAIADEHDALLAIDCVTSLGGSPVELDRHGVDAAYSGTQKCLSCPPGLSPVSFSSRAAERIRSRKSPVQSWYLDLNLIARYWGGERAYHHTAPVHMIYALHEALRLVLAEGLEVRYARHRELGGELASRLESLGLSLPVSPESRLPQLTLARIPEGVDDVASRRALLDRFGLEIGGGLGDFAGNAWRFGLMGHACTPRNITLCTAALASLL